MRARLVAVCLLIVLLVVYVYPLAAQESTEFPPEAAADIQALLDAEIDAGHIVGLTLLIDSPVATFAGASGYADRENEIALQPDEAFRMGSITKMFTTTVILQLVEEGVLSLDDPLTRWLPDVTVPNGDVITLHHLLQHTSGILNYTDDEALIGQYLKNPYQEIAISELVAWINTLDDSYFEPGTDWRYSNTNYILLGLIIEAATGSPAVNVLRSRIFEPLGMAHTYLGDAEPATVDVVQGYQQDGGEWINTTGWNVTWAWTAGALVSTSSDLAIFVRALFGGDLFASDDTLNTMLDTTGSRASRYGLGITSFSAHGLDIGELGHGAWGHDGGIPGYISQLIYVPDADLVIVVLANSMPAVPFNLLSLVYDALQVALPTLAEPAD